MARNGLITDDADMNNTQTPQPQSTTTSPELTLRRPQEGRMVAGVAAGIAERFDIPVGVVRVGFVVLSFFGGFGVLAYLVGWLLIPEEGSDSPIAGTLFDDANNVTSWLGVGLIIAAILVALSWTNLVRGDFLFAAALLGVGILLFRGDIGGSSRSKGAVATPNADPVATDSSDETVEVAPAAADDGDDTDAPAAPIPGATSLVATGEAEPPATSGPPVSSSPPRPPRKRASSILGGLTFGAILLTLGIMGVLDVAGVTHPAFNHYVAAVVIAAGGGLLVGTLWGRSYGLIAVGLLLLPILAISTLVRVPFGGEIGERIVRPVAATEIVGPVEMAIGDLTIDLRDLERGAPLDLTADLGIGQITVLVPADRPATVRAEIGIGSVELFGDQTAGLGRDINAAWPGSGGGEPIHLQLEAGVGAIRVIATEI